MTRLNKQHRFTLIELLVVKPDEATTARSREKRMSFTLIELLVVIAVVAILVALLLPGLHKARHAALNVGCLSNHRQIGIGMLQFATDNNGEYPDRGQGGNAYVPFHWGEPADGWDMSAEIAEYVPPGPLYMCSVGLLDRNGETWEDFWPNPDTGDYWWPDYAFWGNFDSGNYEFYHPDGSMAASWSDAMPRRLTDQRSDLPLMTCRASWFPNYPSEPPFFTAAHHPGWQYAPDVNGILEDQALNALWTDGSASSHRSDFIKAAERTGMEQQYWVTR